MTNETHPQCDFCIEPVVLSSKHVRAQSVILDSAVKQKPENLWLNK
jgi:hypothetical protein